MDLISMSKLGLAGAASPLMLCDANMFKMRVQCTEYESAVHRI